MELEIGVKYGDLTILEPPYADSKHLIYKCRCNCGAIIRARKDKIINESTAACQKCLAGKKYAEKPSMYYKVVFDNNSHREYTYTCRFCGNVKKSEGKPLRGGIENLRCNCRNKILMDPELSAQLSAD